MKMQSDKSKPNVKQAVPFFAVADMARSLRYYADGLGFEIKLTWTPRGKIEWCWLERGGAALMLQEARAEGGDAWRPQGKVGEGVSICFICEDALALYHEFLTRGIPASEPFVGNRMWVAELTDPDGYNLCFESATEVPEETKLSEWKAKTAAEGKV
ncbi:MAG: VOC family protein [Candidatus Acidiferrales bacterium]